MHGNKEDVEQRASLRRLDIHWRKHDVVQAAGTCHETSNLGRECGKCSVEFGSIDFNVGISATERGENTPCWIEDQKRGALFRDLRPQLRCRVANCRTVAGLKRRAYIRHGTDDL